jgi:hypothetical protein
MATPSWEVTSSCRGTDGCCCRAGLPAFLLERGRCCNHSSRSSSPSEWEPCRATGASLPNSRLDPCPRSPFAPASPVAPECLHPSPACVRTSGLPIPYPVSPSPPRSLAPPSTSLFPSPLARLSPSPPFLLPSPAERLNFIEELGKAWSWVEWTDAGAASNVNCTPQHQDHFRIYATYDIARALLRRRYNGACASSRLARRVHCRGAGRPPLPRGWGSLQSPAADCPAGCSTQLPSHESLAALPCFLHLCSAHPPTAGRPHQARSASSLCALSPLQSPQPRCPPP